MVLNKLLEYGLRNSVPLSFSMVFLVVLLIQLELANRAGESGWAEPTPGQENNRADRAGPDLNRAAILLT